MPDSLTMVRKFFPEVNRVTDAHKSAVIEVTKADARPAGRNKHQDCAVAVACKRKFHLDGVVISRAIAYLIKKKTATRYLVPQGVQRELIAFDRGGKFYPGEYELQKPSGKQKLGSAYPKKAVIQDPGSRPRSKPRHYTAGMRTTLAGQGSRNERG